MKVKDLLNEIDNIQQDEARYAAQDEEYSNCVKNVMQQQFNNQYVAIDEVIDFDFNDMLAVLDNIVNTKSHRDLNHEREVLNQLIQTNEDLYVPNDDNFRQRIADLSATIEVQESTITAMSALRELVRILNKQITSFESWMNSSEAEIDLEQAQEECANRRPHY